MIRVVIADDHPLVRGGLKTIIAESPDLQFVAEAGDGDAALHALDEHEADVLLLDVSMPGRPFVDTLTQSKARHPNVAVLVLSMHPEESFAIRALKSGASGYIVKDRSPEELVDAIRLVNQGERYVSAELAQQLASRTVSNSAPLHESLSAREFEVLQLFGSGHSAGEIATKLNLSPKTISTYRTRLLEKLNLKNSAELIRYAVKQQLTD